MEEIILEQISNDSVGLNRQIITRGSEGEVTILVDLHASVTNGSSNQNLSYNINILNRELVEANIEKVQAEVDKFVQAVRTQSKTICPIAL